MTEKNEKGILDIAPAAINLIQTILNRSPNFSQNKKEEFFKIQKSLQLHIMSANPDYSMIKILQDERDLLLTTFSTEITEKKMVLIEEKLVSKGIRNGR